MMIAGDLRSEKSHIFILYINDISTAIDANFRLFKLFIKFFYWSFKNLFIFSL
jgi:hypothetical protein